ncbi:MAG: glycosyltransferase, partial [Cyclobacteriaceae bacterium]|nr:glycosyltransferase [Cyclobacteriaceae bacterium]
MIVSYLELAFFIIVGVQLIYWVVWLAGVLKLKPDTENKPAHGVSVVVAANNELQNLQQLIPLLLKQSYHTYEIIIVDDRSSDGSYDYLLGLSQQEPNLKLLQVSELPDHLNGKKYALTLGIKAASYDQILLTDADCSPLSNNWISSFANSWDSQTSFVLGFSEYERKKGLLNYFIRFETILTGIQYVSAAVLGKPYMGVGRNLSYSKTLFLSKKGFHGFQGVTGGDDDLFVNKYA